VVTVNDLADLRAGIDECDAQLVALLAKRNGITEKITSNLAKCNFNQSFFELKK